MKKVYLQVNGPRDAVLMQDDVDLIKAIGGVNAIRFDAIVGRAPTVTVELSKQFTYNGPAEIQVVPSQPPALTVLEFLTQVDPGELEAAALKVGGGLGGPSTGEAFLMALKAMVRELDGA